MSNAQTIIAALYADLAKITVANGYANTITKVFKGYPGDNFTLPIAYFILGDDTAKPITENYIFGEYELTVVVGIKYRVDAKLGNITDQQEINLKDLDDWVTGVKGTDKCLSLRTPESAYTVYITDHLRTVEYNVETGSMCAIKLKILFNTNI